MATIPNLGQTHDTWCGLNMLIQISPPTTGGQSKQKQILIYHKNQTDNQITLKCTQISIKVLNKNNAKKI